MIFGSAVAAASSISALFAEQRAFVSNPRRDAAEAIASLAGSLMHLSLLGAMYGGDPQELAETFRLASECMRKASVMTIEGQVADLGEV